jgi:hypothetical protein
VCAIGAINFAHHGSGNFNAELYPEVLIAAGRLIKHLGLLEKEKALWPTYPHTGHIRGLGVATVASWNDKKERTVEQVAAALRGAAHVR